MISRRLSHDLPSIFRSLSSSLIFLIPSFPDHRFWNPGCVNKQSAARENRSCRGISRTAGGWALVICAKARQVSNNAQVRRQVEPYRSSYCRTVTMGANRGLGGLGVEHKVRHGQQGTDITPPRVSS